MNRLYACMAAVCLSFFCLLFFAGCGKEKGIDTTFELTTLYQMENKGGEALYPYAGGYIFDGDTTLYQRPEYSQAVSGTLTTRGGSTAQAAGAGIPDGTGLLSFPHITNAVSTLVVYDTETETFAWRKLLLEEGVDKVHNKLRFRRWRTGVYKEAGWAVYSVGIPDDL